MSCGSETATTTDRFELVTRQSRHDAPGLAEEVSRGLSSRSKFIPSRFFYDDEGSAIFEEICALPEYYLTRAERSILERRADEIIRTCSTGTHPLTLVELGSGSAEKTRVLIEALLERQDRLIYRPIDISRGALRESAEDLLSDHPELTMHAIAGEYEAAFDLLAESDGSPRLILWLGSSVGNLHKPTAAEFLRRIREIMAPSDRMLIGIDLRKDRERLERAYDDSQGVTARFNFNLLERINRELDADFDVDRFDFRVQYREDSGSVESHLVSLEQQLVTVGELGESFEFEAGETIHTEDSYKYSPEEIEDLASKCDMQRISHWLDGEALFSVNLFAPL